MINTWEKIVHHIRTIYGSDINNGLHNKTTVLILLIFDFCVSYLLDQSSLILKLVLGCD